MNKEEKALVESLIEKVKSGILPLDMWKYTYDKRLGVGYPHFTISVGDLTITVIDAKDEGMCFGFPRLLSRDCPRIEICNGEGQTTLRGSKVTKLANLLRDSRDAELQKIQNEQKSKQGAQHRRLVGKLSKKLSLGP